MLREVLYFAEVQLASAPSSRTEAPGPHAALHVIAKAVLLSTPLGFSAGMRAQNAPGYILFLGVSYHHWGWGRASALQPSLQKMIFFFFNIPCVSFLHIKQWCQTHFPPQQVLRLDFF